MVHSHLLQRDIGEKTSAAGSSVIAAVFLTATKITVGLLTGSLGILAEAAHSALDLVAALTTYFAVRISSKPPDFDHTYGHGKVDNLSALFETVLLFATCAWIVYEAIYRLFIKFIPVDVNIWSFVVMVTSIIVDASRSRILFRTAKKYNSQALEADALHFSTDIWGSVVVILGLVCLLIGRKIARLEFLHHADAVAALIVAAVVIYICIRLGIRTINALLDTAPAGMGEKITKIVEAMPGIVNCHSVRVRNSGAQLFVDIHVLMDGNQSLYSTHALTEEIENKIQGVVKDADVLVHPEPDLRKKNS